ncbi:MAG: S8 family serine peptidase [Acidobacteria bacterium]|nr:S8 family serine peptidase [Acidobacteriota bacterium]
MNKLALFAVLALFPALAGAATIERALSDRLAASPEPVAVIVRFADSDIPAPAATADRGVARTELIRTLQERAGRSQARALALLRERGIAGPISLWMINALAATVPPGLVHDLAALPGVASVALDREFAAPRSEPGRSAPESTRAGATEWNVLRVRAPELWDLGFEGAGLVIANFDTGADPLHPDLATRWRGGANSWYDPYGQHATPTDRDGHGTRTTGILVGGDNGGTYIGVAPAAKWIAAKIFNDAGQATYSAIHQAFQWALDPDRKPNTQDAPDVVNNSWGFSDTANVCNEEFRADVNTLKAAGIAVVFSAGNVGPNGATSISPANYPEGYSVGATDDYDFIWTYSSRGPSACDLTTYPVVTAPGVNVMTADLTLGGNYPDSYVYVDGTSFAAPLVSAGMGLLMEAVPAANVANIEWALKASAFDRGPAGADDSYGAGVIDLIGAYELLLAGVFCSDIDGDGVASEGGLCGPTDCNDALPRVWAPVGEVPATLGLTLDKQTLSWTAPAAGGSAGSTVYDTLRSTSPGDFVGPAVCVETNDGADTQATDTATPSAGQAFFYLVRAENACPNGQGTLGFTSSGAERAGRVCP